VRNSVNHSRGRSVAVKGWVDFDRGRVVVSDDGVGFDTAQVPQGHFGLIGMAERANMSGVRLDVSSAETGTNVTIEWGAT